MQFSDTTNKTGLIQRCEQNVFGDNGFGQISGDTDRLQIFTNYLNEGWTRYLEIVIGLDGTWQFDDYNYTTYAIGKTNLVSGQSDYQFDPSFIKNLEIEILNPNGQWITLDQVDEQEFAMQKRSMSQEFANSGTPTCFNRTANSIFLLPAPNYDATAGLKIKFQRPPSYFVYTDTTKVAGMTETHHPFLSAYASWKYTSTRSMDSVPYEKEVIQFEKQIIPKFYGSRQKDTKPRMRANVTNTR